jgi:phosphate starvation-inducible PhoH-like protein
MSETSIAVADSQALVSLSGPRDQHLRAIRDALGVSIYARNGAVHIQGDDEAAVAQAADVLEHMKAQVSVHGSVSTEEVQRMVAHASSGGALESRPAAIEVMAVGRRITPRTPGQSRYVEAIRRHDITLCVGPAGTGKTYLAVAMAVSALRQELIRKIVLVRPAVEAGESLGYLPGDLQAKLNPYLRPLMDALREMMDFEQVKKLMERDVIEVIPLAYMRGRSLNEAFIILDEAQNTTVPQMKMFLTRMGQGSKIIVTGDITQIDLPAGKRSGLLEAVDVIAGVQGVTFVYFNDRDVVRHGLVQRIIKAYEQYHEDGQGRQLSFPLEAPPVEP